MGALLKPDSGGLFMEGIDIWQNALSVTKARTHVGVGFQFPEQQFLCETVKEEILYGLDGKRRDEVRARLEPTLRTFGLSPSKLLKNSPFRLSIGEARRLALASVVAKMPRVLLLDEPTAGLDGGGTKCVLGYLTAQKEKGITMVIVSHDLDFLAHFASRIIILSRGEVCADASAEHLLTDKAILHEHGYDPPEIVQIAEELMARGVQLNRRLLSVEELQRLCSVFRS
jgi:energy-coupling factor transport system ATP-binding protein